MDFFFYSFGPGFHLSTHDPLTSSSSLLLQVQLHPFSYILHTHGGICRDNTVTCRGMRKCIIINGILIFFKQRCCSTKMIDYSWNGFGCHIVGYKRIGSE